MIKILIVEKSAQISSQIANAVKELNYQYAFAENILSSIERIGESDIDLIIANYNADACELCSGLRDAADITPVIVTADNITRQQKRKIFRSGADGYLEIPFDEEELQMRIKNLLWRCHLENKAEPTYGNCKLNTETMSVETVDKVIELRRMEFLLLEKLLSYPGRIFTRAQLLDSLWGYDCESGPRTVDTHIRRLRKKFKEIDAIKIQTIRGIGYRAVISKKDKTE